MSSVFTRFPLLSAKYKKDWQSLNEETLLLMPILKPRGLLYYSGMNKISKNESGFGVVEGILVLIIVLLIGFISYYTWHNQKNSDKDSIANANTAPSSSSTKTNAASSQKYLAVKEWGVKIQLADAGDITYTYQGCSTTYGCSSYASNYDSLINVSIKNDTGNGDGSDVVYRSSTRPVSEDVNGLPSVDHYKKVGVYYYWTQGAFGDSALDKSTHADLLNITAVAG